MTNSANILTFGSFDGNDGVYTELLGMSLGVPSRFAEELGGPGVDIAALGPLDESGHVESWFRIGFKRTSVDTVFSAVDLLRAELRDLSTITVGLEGSAYTGTLTPTIARCVDVPLTPPLDSELIRTFKTIVDVFVRREAPVYGAATALYTAQAFSLPAVLDLSAMTGVMKTPLDVMFNAATANIHHLACGLYPEAAALSKFVFFAPALTWSAGAAAADTAGYPAGVGNTLWKTNAAAGDYTDLPVTDFLGGTYALYANVKRDAAASPATIGTPYGSIDIEGTDLRRQLIGLVSLPCASVRGAATSTLRVTLCGDGTDYAYVNTLEVVPVGWGAWSWHHGTAGSSADKLCLEDGLTYADDAASPAYVTLGSEVKALGGTLVVTGEGTAEAPTLAVAGTVTYEPRHEQLPSAGGSTGPGI